MNLVNPYLGAPIGCNEYVESFVCDQVAQWSSELEVLTEFTKSQPHAAYSFSVLQATESWAGPGNEARSILGSRIVEMRPYCFYVSVALVSHNFAARAS